MTTTTRRPPGLVKAIVAEGHALGLTARQLSERSGVSKHVLYHTARRMGLRLKPIQKKYK